MDPPQQEGNTLKDFIKEQRAKAMQKRAAWVVRQIKKGRTRKDVAEELGMSPARVGQIVKEAGGG